MKQCVRLGWDGKGRGRHSAARRWAWAEETTSHCRRGGQGAARPTIQDCPIVSVVSCRNLPANPALPGSLLARRLYSPYFHPRRISSLARIASARTPLASCRICPFMIDRAGILNAYWTGHQPILLQKTRGGKCKNGQIYGWGVRQNSSRVALRLLSLSPHKLVGERAGERGLSTGFRGARRLDKKAPLSDSLPAGRREREETPQCMRHMDTACHHSPGTTTSGKEFCLTPIPSTDPESRSWFAL